MEHLSFASRLAGDSRTNEKWTCPGSTQCGETQTHSHPRTLSRYIRGSDALQGRNRAFPGTVGVQGLRCKGHWQGFKEEVARLLGLKG